MSESAGAAAPGKKFAEGGKGTEDTVWIPAPDPNAASGDFPRDVAAEAAAAIVEAGEFEGPAEDGDEEDVVAETPAASVPVASVPMVASVPSSSAPSDEQVSRHIARAEALAELGRRQQALDVLNELIVAGAEDVRIWRSLAQIHLELGDGEKALRAADWVVTFQPDDEWGYRLRSSALKMLDRADEAVAAASEAVKLGPDVWQGQAALALALHSTGDLSAAAAAARKATAIAAVTDPAVATETQQVADALAAAFTAESAAGGDAAATAAATAASDTSDAAAGLSHAVAAAESAGTAAKPVLDSEIKALESLEAAVAGSPDGLDDESLQHVGNLVLRALEFSAGAGWLVSFGGIAIPNFDLRFLIPVAVLVVLTAFLFGPARKAGREIWRYLIEYLWQDPKTRSALIMAVAAHVWMIAGSSVGHVQGGSALTIGLITHLAGRSVLAKKAPELNPVKRAPAKSADVQAPDVTSATA